MTRVRNDDVPRIATTVRLAGELLDAHGATVLDIVRSWRAGTQTSGERGTRWEDCTDPACDECPNPTSPRDDDRLHHHPKSLDPTGETAATAASGHIDPTSQIHDELQQLLTRVFADCSRLNTITTGIVPPDTPGDPVNWCTHHLQIGICEPRHRGDECRFCYEFRLLHKKPPPLSLLGIKHRYGRVTKEQVDEALDADARRTDTFDRVDENIRAMRHIAKPVKATSAAPPDEPVDEDPAMKLSDALGRLIAAQETARPRRIERAWSRYLKAHETFIASRATDTTEVAT